jgi:enhancing lycopene biosynthesis protein 2
MSVRVGVLLSGSGVFDGSEIHEAVSILVALDRRGADIICTAPNIPQTQVINHLTQHPQKQHRNVLEESARIARGKIRDLAEISADDLDALILPGGFGVTRHLSDFAEKGAECTVIVQVAKLLRDLHAAKKPIGFACISPVLGARVFGDAGIKVKLSIGTDPGTAAIIEKMGATHQNAGHTEVCVDEENRIASTPGYMHDVGPWTVYQGADNLVEQVLRMAGDVASLVRTNLDARAAQFHT